MAKIFQNIRNDIWNVIGEESRLVEKEFAKIQQKTGKSRYQAAVMLAIGTRGCPGKLYTNLDATQVMRTGEPAERCQVEAHSFYYQQLNSDEIQFVFTQRGQQKLVYKGRCYTLKRMNRNDKCWICASGTRGCPGKLYTNLDATEVIRTGEPAERCQVEAHSFYYQQLNVLKMPVAGDPRPVFEIFDELARNASTSLATAAHFPTWEQARNTMYYSRSKSYPRLPLYILYL
ncbi:hypothetical protein T05_5546, partial [Trichinella murrelli]